MDCRVVRGDRRAGRGGAPVTGDGLSERQRFLMWLDDELREEPVDVDLDATYGKRMGGSVRRFRKMVEEEARAARAQNEADLNKNG